MYFNEHLKLSFGIFFLFLSSQEGCVLQDDKLESLYLYHTIPFHFSSGPRQDEKESKARSKSYMKNGEVIKNL